MLYLVATPIGNLADITLRAIEILKTVDVIAAEDTRHSRHLLAHYNINTSCFSLHDHNESERIQTVLDLLTDKKSVALISDAGTPLISDPGFKLVRAVRAAGFSVQPIPGACAAISGLIASGLPTDRFIFEGFLPVKSQARDACLKQLEAETRTVIFYESPHRIERTVQAIQRILGEHRVISIARELSKSFETIYTDKAENCLQQLQAMHQQKGEFVLMIAGVSASEVSDKEHDLQQLLIILLQELSVTQSVRIACRFTGLAKNIVYEKALALARRNPLVDSTE